MSSDPDGGWACVAYPAAALEAGAWCFFTELPRHRDCESRQQCRERMAVERARARAAIAADPDVFGAIDPAEVLPERS